MCGRDDEMGERLNRTHRGTQRLGNAPRWPHLPVNWVFSPCAGMCVHMGGMRFISQLVCGRFSTMHSKLQGGHEVRLLNKKAACNITCMQLVRSG